MSVDSSDEYGPEPENFTPYRGQLYFTAYRLDVGGYELFRLSCNGTVELVDDINPGGFKVLPAPLTR